IQPNRTLRRTGLKTLIVTDKSTISIGLTVGANKDNITLNADYLGLIKYNSKS
ncbi:hypothetical protein LZ30DRAFT_604567, partial [Colletotrichum cereale]